jgi:hypothetical protein
MRAHDWSDSPLGHPQTWPQSLRTIVASVAVAISDVRGLKPPGLLYNDPYAEILGAASAHSPPLRHLVPGPDISR